MVDGTPPLLGTMAIVAPWVVLLASCARGTPDEVPAAASDDADALARARARMVEDQIRARGVSDPRVLAAMREVPRHEFVPAGLARDAYGDSPLPIGHGQTISQPYIVALMTELARPKPTDKALEVGTGSGYQAAVLARLVARVHTIEIVDALAAEARPRLAAFPNVVTRVGDGHAGWPEEAPFDIILVTAAPEKIPPALLAQLAPGGRLVIPVGAISAVQELMLVEKDAAGRSTERTITPVRFVPLVTRP
jgi:protein-L-isoaspartate(D-aspartate) O-methyltransferase